MDQKAVLEEYNLERAEARLRATDDLSGFIELTWEAVEKKAPFIHNWHIDAVSDHLMAVERNQIKNLIISVPPGTAKSLSVCVFFPSWVWNINPARRFIYASYSESLSLRDSLRCRQLMESEQYKEIFKPKWNLADDQNQKKRYNNTMGGYRIATSVGGMGTGERADYIIVDDPMKATDAASELQRENVRRWWFEEMSTRGANPKDEHRIVIMQRLHQADLAGLCEASGDYEVLKIPMEYNPKLISYSKLNWKDPRSTPGELMWPDYFDEAKVKSLKKTLGSMAAEAQLNQDPKPSEGGLFKRKWWKFYKELPKDIHTIIQYWDCAQKPGITNDYSVCATWGESPTGSYLIDLWRQKTDGPGLESAMKLQYAKHKPSAVVVEDKSAGSSAIQYLQLSTTIPVLPYQPKGDKEVRATAATPYVESGNCYLPEAHPLVEDFIQEHEQFPNGQHDDTVDTTSMKVDWIKTRGITQPRLRSL